MSTTTIAELEFPKNCAAGKEAQDIVDLFDLQEEESLAMIHAGVAELSRLASEGQTVDEQLVRFIDQIIGELDVKLNRQLDEVIHADAYQEVDALWTGVLRMLGFDVDVAILDATVDQLFDDVDQAAGDLFESHLFQKIVRDQYLVLGGKPYTLGCLDYAIAGTKRDMDLAGHLASIGSNGHTPFVLGVDPKLFGTNHWDDLPRNPKDVEKLLERSTLGHYKAFRDTENSKYVAFALPRINVREKYCPEQNRAKGAEFFAESIESSEDRLWLNAAYAVAERIAGSLSEYGWPGASTGINTGGKVDRLATAHLAGQYQWPTEFLVDEAIEPVMADNGLIALSADKSNGSVAVFFDLVTACKPRESTDAKSTADNRLVASLLTILAGSIFAQLSKMILREMIGGPFDGEDIEEHIREFLNQFVLPDPKKARGNPALRYRHPLKEAAVKERCGTTGSARSV